VHHRSTEFRCSIFPNSPPSDPPLARLRSIDQSRSENRPRRDDQQPQIASSSRIHCNTQPIIVPICFPSPFSPTARQAAALPWRPINAVHSDCQASLSPAATVQRRRPTATPNSHDLRFNLADAPTATSRSDASDQHHSSSARPPEQVAHQISGLSISMATCRSVVHRSINHLASSGTHLLHSSKSPNRRSTVQRLNPNHPGHHERITDSRQERAVSHEPAASSHDAPTNNHLDPAMVHPQQAAFISDAAN
ncbi:hypothetical protein ACLOJK_026844, partial [Asimina triloba]